MNKEEVKTYNKKYYQANKAIIAEKAKKKAVCPFCERSVYLVNLELHKLTKLCKNRERAIFEDKLRLLKSSGRINIVVKPEIFTKTMEELCNDLQSKDYTEGEFCSDTSKEDV